MEKVTKKKPPRAGMGRPKGAKNKIPSIEVKRLDIIDKIIAINADLDKEGKGLWDCARQDPKWFHTTFTARTLPKNIEISGPLGGPIPMRAEVVFVGKDKNSEG